MRNRLLAPYYERDDSVPLDIEEYEMSLARITPKSMQERGRRLRKAFPELWAEHSVAALRQVA